MNNGQALNYLPFEGRAEMSQISINSKRLVVAIVGRFFGKADLQSTLACLGHASILYESSGDFLLSHEQGRYHDLVMLSVAYVKEPRTLLILHDILSMPLIFLVSPDEDAQAAQLLKQFSQENSRIDFISFPVHGWEFDFRAYSSLRRSSQRNVDVALNFSMRPLELKERIFGRYKFLPRRKIIEVDGREVRLKPREFELAVLFFQNEGVVLAREWLWSHLWGEPTLGSTRSLDVCVAGIRKGLELNEENGTVLLAVYGRGYQLTHLV